MRTTAKIILLGALAVPQLASADDKMELGAFVGAHFWNDNNELGDQPGVALDPLDDGITFGVRVSRRLIRYVTAEGELSLTPTQSRNNNVDVAALGYRLQALVHPGHWLRNKFQPFVLVGLGGSTASSSDETVVRNDTDFVWHAGVGLKMKVGDQWGLRLDARVLVPPAVDGLVTADGEILLGVFKTFGKKAEKPAVVEAPPPADTDGDGIVDANDKCPNEAETANGYQDDDGCADTPPPPPVSDRDGDGIADDADKCPDQAEDKDGFEDADGCADADNDGDSIPDAADKCPAQAENINNYQDSDGCPDEPPAKVAQFTGAIAGIAFATGSDKLTAGSSKVLDKAVAVLKEYPDVHLEVQGHTDNTGDAAKNRDLSRRRAESVKAYFVKKGIAADRLEATGFGPDRPVADNATAAGRAKNRRVEFRVK